MSLKPGVIRLILFLVLLTCSFNTQAESQKFRHTFAVGYYYGEGMYGAEDETLIRAVLLAYKLKIFPWTWKASLNLIQIDGPGNITSGQSVTPGTSARTGNGDQGVGDTFLSAKYAMRPWNNFKLYTDLGFKIKLPTADEDKGLGTGKADIKLQLDLFRPFSTFSLTSLFGWKYRGDPDDFELNNTSHFSLGLHKKFMPVLSAGLSYDFNENASGNNEHARELFTYISYKFDRHKKFDLYAISGLSDGSPDIATGISFAYLI